MQIKRVVEVWEKGMDGALLDRWPVSDTIASAYLLRLFQAEQHVADPDVLLSYYLSPKQVAALQPYVAEEMRVAKYDFILASYGLLDGQVVQL